MSIDNICGFLSIQEIRELSSERVEGLSHAAKPWFNPRDDLQRKMANDTDKSLGKIQRKGHYDDWLEQSRERILEVGDYDEAAGTIGEIRALGDLLEAQITPQTELEQEGATADFIYESKNGLTVEIEVHSKQMYDEERKNQIFFQETFPDPERDMIRENVAIGERVPQPFGQPDDGEGGLENPISRIAKMKQDAQGSQLNKGNLSILWADFQDQAWLFNPMTKSKFCQPLITTNSTGGFGCKYNSGVFWYGFYGWEEAPIFYWASPVQGMQLNTVSMGHKGRFNQYGDGYEDNMVDLVVLSFLREKIVFQNPRSEIEIPVSLWKKIHMLPYWEYERSRINWPNGELEEEIQEDVNLIEQLARVNFR